MRVRSRPAAAVLACCACLGGIGCGGGGGGGGGAGAGGGGSGSGATPGEGTGTAPPIKVIQVAQTGSVDWNAIYKRDAPGVVTVISTFSGGVLPGATAAQGSGFVISSGGEVVTNAHVVTNGSGSTLRRATGVYVQFGDSNEVPAKVVGADPNADVALLRIDPAGLTLKPLALGSSAGLSVGAPVATLGTPFGEQESLSVGVISATNRAIPSLNGSRGQGTFETLGAIQTDAAINHGNSGGPLVDAGGNVIGINSQLAPESNGNASGVGFAVPVDAVKRSVAQLRAHGSVAYAYLGVSSEDLFPQLAQHLGLTIRRGSILRQVAPGSPAARAGLSPGHTQLQFDAQQYLVGGDVVTKVNGRALNSNFDLAAAVTELSPGQRVTLEVWRGKTQRQVTVTLSTRPNSGG